MDSVMISESVTKILDGHRRGHYDIQQAVRLLEILWRQQSENGRKDVENMLWTTLASEPLVAPQQVGHLSPDVLKVVIRATATFGRTADLPNLVFGRLPWQRTDLMGIWAQSLCSEFSYSMVHHADRFAQATLDLTKALCATYTFAQSAQLTGTVFPQTVIAAAAGLEKTIEHIEFTRFATSLEESQPKPAMQRSQLEELLVSLGLPERIAAAMDKAQSYLQTDDPFNPKQAGDLIRTSMDEVHRAVVQELEKLTGRCCDDSKKDGARRNYMCGAGFITPAEEKFFSAIYALISDEASHKLDAPKETMLVMATTVRGCLSLLLRRLSDRKSAPPANP